MEKIKNLTALFVENLNSNNWQTQTEIIKVIGDIINEISDLSETLKCEAAELIAAQKTTDIYREIFKYSLAIDIYSEIKLIEQFIEAILKDNSLTWQNLFFLHFQITNRIFRLKNVNTDNVNILNWKLLNKSKILCEKELSFELKEIPKEERNDKLAVVLVGQYLAETHGPTKTTLDRSIVLKNMGKKVLIINTAEVLTNVGAVPYYGLRLANYFEEYTQKEKVTWKGEEFAYFQCEKNMPDIAVMEMLLNTIMSLKPGNVILIGATSMVAGLMDKLVPVLSIGLTASGALPTLAKYQTVEERYVKDALKVTSSVGLEEDHIIPGRFTFKLIEQTEHVTREQFSIPEDAFVMACVGGRLDDEITQEFIEMLEHVAKDRNVFWVVIGSFNNFDKIIGENSILADKSINLGFCADVLSRLELCDVYINPTRRGGGTSCVEAMFKGKPVVTVDYGDVAGSVGEEFSVANYKEMEKRLLTYYSDKEYYERDVEIAKNKAALLLDSDSEFRRILAEYDKREIKRIHV